MISTSNLLTRYTEKSLFIFIEHIDIAQPTEPNAPIRKTGCFVPPSSPSARCLRYNRTAAARPPAHASASSVRHDELLLHFFFPEGTES
jgi:hypothetical protein